METLFTGYKKITANGLVRRGRPEGVPLVRFDHILFKHNGRLLRATSHEPRTTSHYFFTSRGLLEANGGLRTATGDRRGRQAPTLTFP